jgi:cytoskeletal protein CcmA (bactofilin family)
MAQASRRRRILSLLVVTGASGAMAQETELGGKIQAGGQVTISADETVDGDLYASGGRVLIEGTVDGDLISAAGQITISGEVSGDVNSESASSVWSHSAFSFYS